MRRLFMLLCALLMSLAACDSGGGGEVASNTSPVQWDTNPSTVVFRAEVRGGQAEGSFLSRNDIPPCTIYGDNRIVWTNNVGGGAAQVLYDQVTNERIIDFVNYLAINEQFYTYEAGADSALPSDVSPVVETLTLFVNNDDRQTDALGGWSINYYERILESCRRISSEPVLFEPEGGWVSAELVAYDSSAPLIVWNSAAAGLSFGELATSGQPRWITGDLVRVLWNTLRESAYDVRFDEGDNQYHVALQVPRVTRGAPAAP
jgi:hypothetical protein